MFDTSTFDESATNSTELSIRPTHASSYKPPARLNHAYTAVPPVRPIHAFSIASTTWSIDVAAAKTLPAQPIDSTVAIQKGGQ